MRIVFFEFVTHFGGASRCIVEMAERLSRHADVSIVDPYGCCELYAKAVRAAGLDYHVLYPREEATYIGGWGNPLVRAGRLAASLPDLWAVKKRAHKLLDDLRPSMISSNNAKGLSMAAHLWTKRQPVPLVGYMHGWYTPDMLPLHSKWLYRRRCSAIMAVSYATKMAAMCSGIDPARIYVLPNPVDVPEMDQRAGRPLDEPLPGMERPIRLILPAGLMKTKGQHTAVKAMRRLLDQGLDATLWLAGDVSKGSDETYVPRTQEMARTLGVADRVYWLGLRNDIPQIMQAATMMVLPTYTEGMPRAVLEAMALGKPVAATPVGGILDLLLPGVTGFLFEVEDDAGLAESVRRAHTDAELAQRVGGNARRFVAEQFSSADHTRKALEFYTRIIEQGF